MVRIQAVSIIECSKNPNSRDKLGVIGPNEIDQNGNQTVREVCERMVCDIIDDSDLGSGSGPRYDRDKSARTHDFQDAADSERQEQKSTKDVIEELRNLDSLEENSLTVADWYLDQSSSRSGILLVIPYSYENDDFVAIIKTPFIEDALQAESEDDTEEIFKEAEEIFRENPHKTAKYPALKHGDLDADAMNIYQKGASVDYPKYWYEFLRLEENLSPNEKLIDALDDSGAIEVDDSSEIGDKVSEKDIEDIEAKIEINGIDISVELSQLNENVFFAEESGEKFVILKGADTVIETKGSSKDKIFDTENFESLRDVLSDYL